MLPLAFFPGPAASLLQSVFAHGVLLSHDEVELMVERGSAVAHCPLSNFFFADVVLPVAELLQRGLKVGGTGTCLLSQLRRSVWFGIGASQKAL